MASRDKIFLDTDVTLDHLADRQPFAEYAHRLFALAETGELTICLSTLSFSNLYYILRKIKGHDDALALLGKLKQLARVSAVTQAEIQCRCGSFLPLKPHPPAGLSRRRAAGNVRSHEIEGLRCGGGRY